MPVTDLERLLSQFHQDWNLQFQTWEALVDQWMASAGPERAARTKRELIQLLETARTEAGLDQELDRLGCEYYAAEDPGGYRGWLTAILHRLEMGT